MARVSLRILRTTPFLYPSKQLGGRGRGVVRRKRIGTSIGFDSIGGNGNRRGEDESRDEGMFRAFGRMMDIWVAKGRRRFRRRSIVGSLERSGFENMCIAENEGRSVGSAHARLLTHL